MKNRIFFSLYLLLLAAPQLTWGQAPSEQAIFLKEITTDKPCQEVKECECGSPMFPDYALAGLPADFGIKRKPGIIIPGSAVKAVKVKAEIAEKWSGWHLVINLADDFGKKLENYTADKSGKKLAFVINGEVLIIATVFEKIGAEIQVTAPKDRIERMVGLLKVIHPEITREIIKVPSNQKDAPDPKTVR